MGRTTALTSLLSHPSNMVLEAHLQQAVLLKKVVDAMKDLCKDVNFDCSEKGIQVQSMDSSHVAFGFVASSRICLFGFQV